MTDAQEHIEKATQGLMKACEDASSMARDHMDAAMKSTRAISKGLEEITRNANDLFQESMARGMNVGKTIMSAKNPREMMDLHNEFMKDCFDCWVAGSGKISEISARMTQDMMSPIAEQANQTMQKITPKASQQA